MSNVLLIEDDIAFSKMLSSFLIKNGYKVTANFSAGNILEVLNKTAFDVVLTDMRLPDKDGIAVLDEVKSFNESLPVIFMTGYANVPSAVKAMKRGAFDYISKPFQPDRVLEIINNALLNCKEHKVSDFPSEKRENNAAQEKKITGNSEASKILENHIAIVAPTNLSVLITGESGTGKEVVARNIHNQSSRKNGPFIAVDCGAIPREIAGSEFFGHLKGSFTGAIDNKMGSFVAADKGTIFLDEVGNLPYDIQVQLLRVLQERSVKPIGSNSVVPVDVRILAATNEDLEKAIEKGTFREDLFYRLNEFSIQVPKLTERRTDIMQYASLFLRESNKILNKNILGFSAEVEVIFMNYKWPGNLRELKNVVKRAVLLSQDNYIEKHTLPKLIYDHNKILFSSSNINERDRIIEILEYTNYNKSKTASILNIDRKTLYNKLKKYEI